MNHSPNLFLIGAPRCGTTSLFAAMKQHPAIYTTVLKEPHFHARDLPVQPHTVTDPDDYRQMFRLAGDRPWRADGSVWHFYSHAAPTLIAEQHPDARIVLLLRHPVRMVASLYGLYRRTGNEGEADADIALLRDGEARYAGTYFPFGLHYRHLLDVTRPLERWRAHLDAGRMRVLFHEEFYAAPEAGFAELCRWLGIDADADISFDATVARDRVREQALRQIRDLPARVRASMLPGAGRHHAGQTPFEIAASTLQRLQAEAQAANRDLPALLGRPVPAAWQTAPTARREARAADAPAVASTHG